MYVARFLQIMRRTIPYHTMCFHRSRTKVSTNKAPRTCFHPANPRRPLFMARCTKLTLAHISHAFTSFAYKSLYRQNHQGYAYVVVVYIMTRKNALLVLTDRPKHLGLASINPKPTRRATVRAKPTNGSTSNASRFHCFRRCRQPRCLERESTLYLDQRQSSRLHHAALLSFIFRCGGGGGGWQNKGTNKRQHREGQH